LRVEQEVRAAEQPLRADKELELACREATEQVELGRFRARCGGLGTLELRLLRFLRSAQPVGAMLGTKIWPSCGSPEFAEQHSINALCDRDLGVLAVADITAEATATSLPAHRIPGFPNPRNLCRALSGAARIPLACLARLAARQSRSSRHADFALLVCARLPAALWLISEYARGVGLADVFF
jgi:hypothetical protein